MLSGGEGIHREGRGIVGQAAVRQEARRSVLEAQAEMKAERDKREKRLSGLGVDVVVALRERDAAVRRCELQSGRALQKILDEGLSMKEALQWCGPEIGRREAGRLIKLVEDAEPSPGEDRSGPDEHEKPQAVTRETEGASEE